MIRVMSTTPTPRFANSIGFCQNAALFKKRGVFVSQFLYSLKESLKRWVCPIETCAARLHLRQVGPETPALATFQDALRTSLRFALPF
jgi:hypothetical protein